MSTWPGNQVDNHIISLVHAFVFQAEGKSTNKTSQQLTLNLDVLLIKTENKYSAKNLCFPDEKEIQDNWLATVKQRSSGLFAMETVVFSSDDTVVRL